MVLYVDPVSKTFIPLIAVVMLFSGNTEANGALKDPLSSIIFPFLLPFLSTNDCPIFEKLQDELSLTISLPLLARCKTSPNSAEFMTTIRNYLLSFYSVN